MKDVLKKLCRSKETHISFLKLFRTLGFQDNYAKKTIVYFLNYEIISVNSFLREKEKNLDYVQN